MKTGKTRAPITHATDGTHPHKLDVFFRPHSVAVIGATERDGSVGRMLLKNLVASPFGGKVYPINPKHSRVLGLEAYPNVAAIPGPVDLAIVVTPAMTAPGIIEECANAGVRGAIIISAGFKETGEQGAAIEEAVLTQARRGNMRIIGPNCLGVMNPRTGFNGTFAHAMALPGQVAFISQSGALGTAILDWSLHQNVGFSAFVSVGSMLDVGWGDLIDYLGNDPHTQSILIYMESIGNARTFLSAAREVALSKPIIVIKAGRTAAAAQAAASHTGALTGRDDVLSAAFRRVGVLRVDTIDELFGMAQVLAKQPRPRGPRATIVTNAGGPGALATDALIMGGGELAELTPQSMEALNQVLPAHWSHQNPVDVLGDASADRYVQAMEIISKESRSDGILVILTLQAMTDATGTAERLKAFAHLEGIPVLASWMGGASVAAGEAILNLAGIPTFAYPDAAAHAFATMWRYTCALRGLYETPMPPSGANAVDRSAAEAVLMRARTAGRTILSESESKQLLAAYCIPTVPTHVAATEDEAVALATSTGFPVVLKLHSETITHKTDVGGVMLNLRDADAVRSAFRTIQDVMRKRSQDCDFLGVTVQPMIAHEGRELILGCSIDEQFGPVILFGLGGSLVEVFQDRALGLPPLTTTLARRMMEETRIYAALKGARGQKPFDLPALEQLMVQFSHLVLEWPLIREIDINPLVSSAGRVLALDARIVLHGPEVRDNRLPRAAIRPYPVQYVSTWTTREGLVVTIRPIRPDDESLVTNFHATLSENTVYGRYFHAMTLGQRTSHQRLTRVCFNDYDREIALVVEHRDPATGHAKLMAIGRLIKIHGTQDSEFALLVGDQFQRHGLGTELLRKLIQIGRDEHARRIVGEILAGNSGMLRVCEKLGFHRESSSGEGIVNVTLDL